MVYKICNIKCHIYCVSMWFYYCWLEFGTLHLSSFTFSRSEIPYFCKFMPNCPHLIIQSCNSKLEGRDPEKKQASFSVFSWAENLLCQKLPDFNLLLGLTNWFALDLQQKFSDTTHSHKATKFWNHPEKRFADTQFLHCSFSKLKHALYLSMQQGKTS